MSFTIYQSDGVTPQDITGWTLSWMLKRKATDADASALVTKAATLTTPASGICTVALTDDDTSALLAGNLYRHELKRTNTGLETVLSYGKVNIKQAVHR